MDLIRSQGAMDIGRQRRMSRRALLNTTCNGRCAFFCSAATNQSPSHSLQRRAVTSEKRLSVHTCVPLWIAHQSLESNGSSVNYQFIINAMSAPHCWNKVCLTFFRKCGRENLPSLEDEKIDGTH